MRRIFITIAVAVFCCVTFAQAGDAVAPATTNVINARGESEVTIGGVYFSGSTLLLTNCWMYSDGGSTTQYLAGVTVELRVGNVTETNVYTGIVYASAAAYTDHWGCSITVPDLSGTINVQTKITDSSTNIYIYPWKRLATKDSL